MTKENSSLKDKVIGKVKEVEGKLTNDKLREAEGKAQQAKGKLKDKADKVKKDLQDKD
ncbi:MAG: CsbD family protein [Lactobacillus sp.]|nr:CsbD family protein [Lactobacillus sp.]